MSLTFKKLENKELNISIDTDIDGKEVRIKGHDVALALGYKRPEKAIIDHIKDNKSKKSNKKSNPKTGQWSKPW